MLLYGVPLSPFVRKTLFMIYEMNLEVDRELVVPGSHLTAFRQASPLGRIPALVDGSQELWDSSAICHYLARWPALAAWLDRVGDRPAFRQLCADARTFRP